MAMYVWCGEGCAPHAVLYLHPQYTHMRTRTHARARYHAECFIRKPAGENTGVEVVMRAAQDAAVRMQPTTAAGEIDTLGDAWLGWPHTYTQNNHLPRHILAGSCMCVCTHTNTRT